MTDFDLTPFKPIGQSGADIERIRSAFDLLRRLVAATAVQGVIASMTQISTTTYTTTLETLVVPRGGVYEVVMGGFISSQPGTTNSYLGLHVNGTNDTAFEIVGSLGSPEHFEQRGLKTLAAGDTVTLRTRVDATHTNARYGGRYLILYPISLNA